MIQLVYTSISTSPITSDLVAKLCARAVRNNRRDEISGVLVTNDDHFMQVMEGPKTAVEDTFLRMMVDERHRQLILLSRRLITQREFGQWEMLHCHRDGDRADVIGKVTALTGAAPDHVSEAFASFIGGRTHEWPNGGTGR